MYVFYQANKSYKTRDFTMKKIHIFFSCALIIGATQLNAMKRDASQITEAPEELWVPSEIITKIAATCDHETRTILSLTNKCFNHWASIKTNPQIVDQPEFKWKQKIVFITCFMVAYIT